jgi:hypothetical protein
MNSYPISKKSIINMAESAVSLTYYDRAWVLKMFMCGQYDFGKSLADQSVRKWSSGSTGDILPTYPDAITTDQPVGVQNYGLVNSRYNVQRIVFADARFSFDFEDSRESEVNNAWLKKMWSLGSWSTPFMDVCFSFEQNGIGFAKCGVLPDGRIHWKFVDLHNCIWDHETRNPNEYRWYITRDFLSIADAAAKYGHLFYDPVLSEVENGKNIVSEIERLATNVSFENGQARGTWKQLVEWEYNSYDKHCVILGDLRTGRMANWDENTGKYQWANTGGADLDDLAGPQPFDCIPIAKMWDIIVPGRARPVGKAEFTISQASRMNQLESAMGGIIDNAPPLNGIAMNLITPEMKKKLEDAISMGNTDPKEIMKLIAFETDDIKNGIVRLPGAEFPVSMLQLRGEMAREMTASTGVNDNDRGNTLDGDRVTAREVSTINSKTDVQPGHIRKQYAEFLQEVAKISRKVGAKYSRWQGAIYYEAEGSLLQLDLTRYPIHVFLKKEAEVTVSPESVEGLTTESRQQKRLQRFVNLDSVAMQMGVVDAVKVFKDVYRAFGVNEFDALRPDQQAAMPPGMPPEGGQDPTAALNEARGTQPQS